MKLRRLGATGIDVSEIGVGAWQLGGNPQWGGRPDEQESLAIVEEALARGVNFFDTAPGYAEGRSEALLGRALAGKRDQVVLCTKFGEHEPGGFDVNALAPSVDGSLTQLRTDYLDVLLLHNPPAELHDGDSPAGAAMYQELERLQRQGKIRSYGVSLDWSADLDLVATSTGSRACEVLFNAFFQETLPAMERAAERGMGLVVKVPLDSGWLSGRYRAGASFADVRSRWSPEVIERRAELLRQFDAALPEGTSTLHGALQFVLAHQCVSTVIPGMRSVAQLRDNLAATDAALPAQSMAEIRRLWHEEISHEPLGW